jgi:hypothetical protein
MNGSPVSSLWPLHQDARLVDCAMALSIQNALHKVGRRPSGHALVRRVRCAFLFPTICAIVILNWLAPQLESREKKDAVQYGTGLIVNVPAPEAEVVQAVEEVVQNGIIRGSREYNKDDYISGAKQANESHLFPAWTGGGKVFYKVRLHALDPRNFKDSGDVGTLAVRYIVTSQDDESTILRIDAVFAEDFRHTVHPSSGSVEGSEYSDIHDHIQAIELMKRQTANAEKEKQEGARKRFLGTITDQKLAVTSPLADSQSVDAPPQAAGTTSSAQSLERRVQDLRRQVERLVRAPGAPLKSAPFHTATTLQSVPTGTEVLIVISTTYWYGVETHDGQHGWMLRTELEELP